MNRIYRYSDLYLLKDGEPIVIAVSDPRNQFAPQNISVQMTVHSTVTI